MAVALPDDARSSHGFAAARGPGEARLRLMVAAEALMATRGLDVPNRVIAAAAGQRNQSAIIYHFGSRPGLIDAIRERHETPIAQHRRYLIARLPGLAARTTRHLVEAHIQPVTAEMLRCPPSHWARSSEMVLLDQPLRMASDGRLPVPAQPDEPGRPARPGLHDLMAARLTHLPERPPTGLRWLSGS